MMNAAGSKTIGVDLWGGQARTDAENRATVVRSATHEAVRDPRALFLAAYPRFAQPCREVDEPGVAVIAVDERTGRPAGLVRLRARFERHVAAIIGRHNACDLYLTGSDRLALRHLALVLDPVSSYRAGDATVRYRILDLRTTNAFLDESGRELRGVRCEGPAMLRCAGHALFVLPLGDPTDWPASAEDAWSCLPERVYFDELAHSARGSLPQIPRATDLHRSMIIRTQGPRDTGPELVEQGDLAGILELSGPRSKQTIRVGHDALRDGVLLGRYARCDGAALVDDPSLSRVHALLIQVDNTVLVVDTASINGTRQPGEHRARVIAIHDDTELVLGTSTRARWRWVA